MVQTKEIPYLLGDANRLALPAGGVSMVVSYSSGLLKINLEKS